MTADFRDVVPQVPTAMAESLDWWADHGMPADESTRDLAAGWTVRLWALLREAWSVVDDALADADRQRARCAELEAAAAARPEGCPECGRFVEDEDDDTTWPDGLVRCIYCDIGWLPRDAEGRL